MTLAALSLSGRPTVDVPMPIGFADEGFDPSHVTGVGVHACAGARV